MKRSPAERRAADLKQLRGITWSKEPHLHIQSIVPAWLVFSASLRPAELSKQRPGFPPGQGRVRGIAGSIAPSRPSPHWAQLSDPLPLLPLVPLTIAELTFMELSVSAPTFPFIPFFDVALLLNL